MSDCTEQAASCTSATNALAARAVAVEERIVAVLLVRRDLACLRASLAHLDGIRVGDERCRLALDMIGWLAQAGIVPTIPLVAGRTRIPAAHFERMVRELIQAIDDEDGVTDGTAPFYVDVLRDALAVAHRRIEVAEIGRALIACAEDDRVDLRNAVEKLTEELRKVVA
jgi:hypothetical protein